MCVLLLLIITSESTTASTNFGRVSISSLTAMLCLLLGTISLLTGKRQENIIKCRLVHRHGLKFYIFFRKNFKYFAYVDIRILEEGSHCSLSIIRVKQLLAQCFFRCRK